MKHIRLSTENGHIQLGQVSALLQVRRSSSSATDGVKGRDLEVRTPTDSRGNTGQKVFL